MFYLNVYINIFYCLYFVLLKAIFDFNDKHIFLLASIIGIFVKLLFIWFYSKKKSLEITVLKDKLDITVLIILLLIITKNHYYNKFGYGSLYLIIHYISFTLGYFIGLKKKSIEMT